MKRIIIVCCFISLCCLCAGTSSKAKLLVKNEKAGPHCTCSLDDKGTLTIRGRGKVVDTSSLHIPFGMKIKKVVVCKGITAIGECSIGGEYDVEKIVLPDTVRTLERSCFSNFTKIKKIRIPKKVTVIPYSAFNGCVSLEEIQFPENLKTIQYDAFGECHSLKKIVIPDSVTDMDKEAIRKCHGLKTVVLPKSLKKAAPEFEDCLALRTIKNRSSLSVRLDSASGRRVWRAAGKKTNMLKGHQTAKTRGAKFQITYDLRGGNVVGKRPTSRYYGDKVDLPRLRREGYEFLGWRCLKVWTYGEEFLRTYDRDAKLIAWFVRAEIDPQPDGAVRILITDDKIPWQDRAIPIEYGYVVRFRKVGREEPLYWGYMLSGKEEICNSPQLTPGRYLCDVSYYYYEDDIQGEAVKEWYFPRWIDIEGRRSEEIGVQLSERTQNVQAEEPVYSDKTVLVPVGGDEEPMPTVPFKNQKAGPHCTWSLNKKGVARIKGTGKVTLNSDLFFAEGDKIKKIVVSKGITIIGDGAFSGCFNVKKIVLPDTVNTLERYCFEGCKKLKTIKIPQKVKVIPYAAFQNDYALENIQLPKKLARIYGHAFDGCRSLKKIVVPDTVKHMAKNAIVNCRSLKTVVLPKKLKKKELSFENCLALRKIKNRSSMSMKLDSVDGHRIWKVNGKKTKVLKAYQTAKTRGTKFKLSYKLQGGTVDGKLPSYHYYGEKVQLPRAARGEYDFIGWHWQKDITYGEEFVRWLKKDVTLTAYFVKAEVESLPGGIVKAGVVDDNLSWRTYTSPGMIWYVLRFRPVGGGKEIYPFFLQNGMEKTSTILKPGTEYIYDISYLIEVFDDADAIKKWYFPKRIYVQP